MKKTCGALVIGLLITTNVYAKETKKVSACEDKSVKSMVMLLRQGSLDNKWKPTEMQCESIRYMMNAAFESAYSIGLQDGSTTKPLVSNCPPCSLCESYDVPLQNDSIKRQQEIDDARLEQYYLDQSMNRHR